MWWRRCAPMLTALSLLASAATASAECAWVLWQETRTDLLAPGRLDEPASFFHGKSLWEIQGAFPTQAHCQSAYWDSFDRVRKQQRPIYDGGKFVGQIHTDLQCLPDTVDPRGPKGK